MSNDANSVIRKKFEKLVCSWQISSGILEGGGGDNHGGKDLQQSMSIKEQLGGILIENCW